MRGQILHLQQNERCAQGAPPGNAPSKGAPLLVSRVQPWRVLHAGGRPAACLLVTVLGLHTGWHAGPRRGFVVGGNRRALACIVMRVRAFRSRQRAITSSKAALRRRGRSMACAGSVMACIFWMKGSALKGVWPCTIWYRMHPRLHTSEGRPTCAANHLREGSGDSGVEPHTIDMCLVDAEHLTGRPYAAAVQTRGPQVSNAHLPEPQLSLLCL